jgi:hypothetical protein
MLLRSRGLLIFGNFSRRTRKWIKTFFKGNFLLIIRFLIITTLRTHSSSFPLATWDNSDGVAASLFDMGIWAAAQDHSGY